MNWNNITLQQFQDIYRLSINTELDEIEKLTRTVCIIHGLTESEVDDLTLMEFNKLSKECSFLLSDKIPGKVQKTFMVGLNKYAINYKPTTLKHRQYVEIITFAEKPIENMHNIMASLVNQVSIWGKKKNLVDDHARIADEMLKAPLVSIYHSSVFFCKLYSALIKRIQGYLIKEMTSKGMTEQAASKLIMDSQSAMDGFIAQSK